jgi:5-formyltetrahydrofolate cyclo-ligase
VDKAARALKLHRVDSLDELGEGVWGIREPRDHAPLIAVRDIDFVLVPGVAFDRRGHRLGYGAGFYDRLLVDCAPTAARVVGAFACQLVDDIPVGPHDQAIHRILTENESIECP